MYKYFCLLSLLILAGCGGESGPRTVKAAGIVTLDGSPVAKATVTFIDSSATNTAIAITDDQGRFALRHKSDKDGAVPGAYKVQVSKTVLGGNEKGGTEITISHGLPAKYAVFTTSGLEETVPDSGKDDFKIELKSK
ncbi:MAG: carboxypeptidase-like regulatory domain-containing protein [Pirellulales bacterium]